MKKLVVFVTCIALSACQSLGQLVTPNAQLVTQAAVYVAVGAAVGTDPLAAKSKALKIKMIATELFALDSGQSVALSALETAVSAKIASLNLPPPDLLAAELLVSTLATLVTNQTQAGAAASSAQVAIAQVLQDVIMATGAYGV